jgi:hypothetical protein
LSVKSAKLGRATNSPLCCGTGTLDCGGAWVGDGELELDVVQPTSNMILVMMTTQILSGTLPPCGQSLYLFFATLIAFDNIVILGMKICSSPASIVVKIMPISITCWLDVLK